MLIRFLCQNRYNASSCTVRTYRQRSCNQRVGCLMSCKYGRVIMLFISKIWFWDTPKYTSNVYKKDTSCLRCLTYKHDCPCSQVNIPSRDQVQWFWQTSLSENLSMTHFLLSLHLPHFHLVTTQNKFYAKWRTTKYVNFQQFQMEPIFWMTAPVPQKLISTSHYQKFLLEKNIIKAFIFI